MRQLRMTRLQGRVDPDVRRIENVRSLQDLLALIFEAVGDAVDLREEGLRNVLQDARLFRQSVDRLHRMACDVLAGLAHGVDAVHHGFVEVRRLLRDRVAERVGMQLQRIVK